ncbi:MAG: sulfur carrier protein ThiS [Candidatus Thioglobus sp.]|nr:sulfur carrier protein ThiS [Candidatus Thioglobus sp.]
MKLQVNGNKFELRGENLTDLIGQLGYENQRIALEVNSLIVPKSQHSKFILSPGDKIEIIKAVGGG